ncbi:MULTISPECIES: flavin reductase family protein [unclassified Exiguobacterium]|uniref:flavin reductase family protein n=1 Tax=unclassified Exiguobacterium TaxID=2644629 RepID=UPI00103DE202|nr:MULTISPECIES: flavin reductase family protein [unclassified Exiguobacterium]TCI32834.1 flavin reductase family protein [Exiguobacterium sp. SH4S7]TCI42075.1 flavin reductase family protein [Exiguobacterium sp. SH5S32]TCI49448.1 flavin reductase family protein [Exiguobacterium sp. SH1S4]TCI59438.1 flavin reductase family protein [Exiguobacterium sp. SH0S2]TCI66775.1 flavin reductase family protein [Exiguobacterium sp. SH1S1]
MLSIDPTALTERDTYKFLIGSIVPRPIAFVTTRNGDVVNAAPFSYFNIIASNPPLVSVSIQRKDGVMKDTARNAVATEELVIHIVDETNVALVNETAANLGPEESELDRTTFTLEPSDVIETPGVKEAKIRMECKLHHHVPIEHDGKVTADVLIARVVRFHVDPELYQAGRVDAAQLAPVSRLAGDFYAKLGEQFEIERPK